MRQPVEPLLVTDLIPEVRGEFVRVLESLSDDAWSSSTVCTGWTVRDVAQHVLADDVGLLSTMRDHDGQYFDVKGWDDLVALINAQNDLWVKATRRLSRRLLIDLLRFTGQQVYDLFLSLDPYRLGGPVSWAGSEPAPVWLHVARELTEYWTHHQHICDAVGVTSLKEARFVQPVLSAFVRALPHTFRAIDAPEDTLVEFVINGEGGGEWHLVREPECWVLYADTDLNAASTVRLDSDTAWRLFTRNQPVEQLRRRIILEGDTALGAAVLNTVAIIA